ncbi:MAG: hypothetical protein BWY95_02606 [Bacteroidetes bacterium ADurb.BinA104]|nr:MAG: hypothetical protein BWY95_02606 [Bacteroidetes bacterium ADurb.BinA104]
MSIGGYCLFHVSHLFVMFHDDMTGNDSRIKRTIWVIVSAHLYTFSSIRWSFVQSVISGIVWVRMVYVLPETRFGIPKTYQNPFRATSFHRCYLVYSQLRFVKIDYVSFNMIPLA